jgi:uncharacterized protein involved in exopolysaccharide biosynthesis
VTQADKTVFRAAQPSLSEIETDGVSLFDLGSVVLRNIRSVALAMLAGVLLAILPAIREPRQYVATASFIPQGSEQGRSSGLSALAGQFGIAVPSANLSQSPQFYADLLTSRVILAPLARDTLTVPEVRSQPISIPDLLEIPQGPAERRLEGARLALVGFIDRKVSVTTGAVTVSVSTPWRTASLEIASRLLDRVNEFNLHTRQSQAAAERRFVEGRLSEARETLRTAENRLQSFLTANRQILGSPELTFDRDRLQREVNLQQGIVANLAGAYEDTRVREVRDTPVITVIEPAAVGMSPAPRRLALHAIIGAMFGAFAGVVFALLKEMIHRRRAAGDPHLEELLQLASGLRSSIGRRFSRRSAVGH